MNVYFSGIAGSALLFILTLASGILLSQLGKPYHTVIFNAHKLIAVGAVFVIVRNIYRLQHAAPLRASVGPGVLLIIGLLFVTLIISGSLLSLQNGGLLTLQMSMLKLIHTVHRATPLLALIAAGLALTLLTRSAAA
jgi:hypothetical protein